MNKVEKLGLFVCIYAMVLFVFLCLVVIIFDIPEKVVDALGISCVIAAVGGGVLLKVGDEI